MTWMYIRVRDCLYFVPISSCDCGAYVHGQPCLEKTLTHCYSASVWLAKYFVEEVAQLLPGNSSIKEASRIPEWQKDPKPHNHCDLHFMVKLIECFRWFMVTLLISLSRNRLQAQHTELQDAGFLFLKPRSGLALIRMLSAKLPLHKTERKCIRHPDTLAHSPTLWH